MSFLKELKRKQAKSNAKKAKAKKNKKKQYTQCPDVHVQVAKYRSNLIVVNGKTQHLNSNSDSNNNVNNNSDQIQHLTNAIQSVAITDTADADADADADTDTDSKAAEDTADTTADAGVSSDAIGIAKTISVVHISDTHLRHRQLEHLIPDGDILIHSGDMGHKRCCKWAPDIKAQVIQRTIGEDALLQHIPQELLEFNEWIGTLPHKHKIVIAGNHEIVFNDLSPQFIQKHVFTNCIYLQDSGCELYGLSIYGTPWTTSTRMAFSSPSKQFLYSKWSAIPTNTDILITHLPPKSIFDKAWRNPKKKAMPCALCNGETHAKYKHWGCAKLKQEIESRIQPAIHLFGHVHDHVGYQMSEDNRVLYINSAMDLRETSHKINVMFDLDD